MVTIFAQHISKMFVLFLLHVYPSMKGFKIFNMAKLLTELAENSTGGLAALLRDT
jgi:hypothetical protein